MTISALTKGLLRRCTVAAAPFLLAATCGAHTAPAAQAQTPADDAVPTARKVLIIGDSMTGWLAERLTAYGQANGFDVATVVWDGSTIGKWAGASKLHSIVEKANPDAVFISLGLNELFEAHPARLQQNVAKITSACGNRPFVWIGPPSWPGHDKGEALNAWLEKTLPQGSFFRSFDMQLPRQSRTNPHPTRQGCNEWMDSILQWLPESGSFKLSLDVRPDDGKIARGKEFRYVRMKEAL